MKAIILVAGFGTRLYPLTQNTPKALLKLGNKSILDFLVEKLEISKAVTEIILVTNGRFFKEFILWHRDSSYRKRIHILTNFVDAPERRFGAVRDLQLALRSGLCGSDDFLVFCGDNYFDFPLSHFIHPILSYRHLPLVGVYDVKEKSIASECGVVLIDSHNLITNFEEKPKEPKSTKVSIGIYYLPRAYRLKIYEYLEIEKLNPDRIGDFFAWLSKKESLYAVDFDGAWFDIGNKCSYEAAKCHLEHISFLRGKEKGRLSPQDESD